MDIRRDITDRLLNAASHFAAITITGPRQSGKTTLCRLAFPHLPYVSLEDPSTRAGVVQDPRGFLARHPDGAIIDEVQRAPDILSYLQVEIDDDRRPGRWILTGSYNLALLSSVSQSLAGRTAVLQLLPLSWSELQRANRVPQSLDEAILNGGYPEPADKNLPLAEWMIGYVSTYLERDIRGVRGVSDLAAFQNFVTLAAGRSGQLLNLSSLASDVGITQPTAKAWLSVLEATYVAFRLMPWFQNVGKRLTKMPKLHFHDTGLACWLLGIRTVEELRTHPLRGALFETWVANEILKHRLNHGESRRIHFYRDAAGREADVLVPLALRRILVEVKAGQTITDEPFKTLAKVAEAMSGDYENDRVIVYGGQTATEQNGTKVVPWSAIDTLAWM